MVVMSEIADYDNGDKKSPQELPGGETRIITTTRRCSLESVPVDVTECIVASFSRYEYPAIALVSSHFRRLIASHNFRLARSQLSALLGFSPHELPRWHILYRTNNNASLRLRRVDSLPPVPYGCAVVAIGRRLGTGVIDGKIFVMGGCETPSADWVEAFDLERRVWLRSTWPALSNVRIDFVTYAVVKQRIYTLSPRAWCHAYDPRERTLETWAGGHELRGLWQASSCVVDGMLFNVGPGRSLGHLVIVFDLKKQVWRPVKVKGAHGLPPCVYQYGYESRMGSVDRKLVIFVGNQTQWWDYEGEKSIWCVEIGLRRRLGGEIRGKVESVDVVFRTTKSTRSIELCRTVIV
uniref:F-box domain-containing protein n=1 Tax=Brassica oleracea var. oleracea TaxID=109376 RepID=A0A0D3BDB8_BRAOL